MLALPGLYWLLLRPPWPWVWAWIHLAAPGISGAGPCRYRSVPAWPWPFLAAPRLPVARDLPCAQPVLHGPGITGRGIMIITSALFLLDCSSNANASLSCQCAPFF